MSLYSAIIDNVSCTATQDLFELVAPSTATVTIHYIGICQSTEAGDAKAGMQRVLFTRGHTVSGSGGTTPSIQKWGNSNDAASGSTVEANNTTAANTSGVNIYANVFNIQSGFDFLPTPEMRLKLAPSQRFTVNFPSIGGDGTVSYSATIVWEE